MTEFAKIEAAIDEHPQRVRECALREATRFAALYFPLIKEGTRLDQYQMQDFIVNCAQRYERYLVNGK